MKQLFSICLVTISLLLSFIGCKPKDIEKKQPINLLQDGEISGKTNFWKFIVYNAATSSVDTLSKDFVGNITNAHYTSGPNSLMISRIQNTGSPLYAYWRQVILNPSIPKGATPVLKAKIKTDNVIGATVWMSALGLTNNDQTENYWNTNEGISGIADNSDFKEYTLRLENYSDKFGPTEKLYITISTANRNAPGTIYIDDISLTIE
ncbi:hypothetical protein LX87_04081 [Larkinella arboricola]|uniref:DUF5017 domain-containing protein n=1 Tax=Larkinella arboricola TaxID=643671 RepID=A0A327WQH3_LARAB|nr:hypothetical protein [Larkinella arboricola]RAJ94196.1 hypothetical protein LX87_04081 [Larkinella arboricola]